MSNCVEIHNDVILSPEHFDCARLLADVEKHKSVTQSFERPMDEQNFYWFLTPDVVYTDGDETILSLGPGRSMHTWRDLAQTAHTLALYVKIETACLPLLMADEYDGFETEFRHELEVKRFIK